MKKTKTWQVTLLAAAIATAMPAEGAIVQFDGDGDGVSWQDPLNWTGDALPTTSDVAQLATPNTLVDQTFTLQGLDILAGSASVATSRTLSLRGDSNNNGLLILDAVGSGSSTATLNFNGSLDPDLMLDGTGEIRFNTANQNTISSTGATVTLGANQLVRTHGAGAQGNISAAMINEGTVRADGGTITFSGGGKANVGNLEAINGGDLRFINVGLDQTSTGSGEGVIRIDDASSLTLQSNTVTAGAIQASQTQAAVSLVGNVTLDDVDLSNTQIDVDSGQTVILKNAIQHDGSIVLADSDPNAINRAEARLDSSVGLTGTGEILFANANRNVLASTGTATLGAGQTVRTVGAGSVGEISASLVNQGNIATDGGTLTFTSADKANQSSISASNGGLLSFSSSIDLDQTGGGSVDLDGASTLAMTNGILTGGSVTGGGNLAITGGVTVDGVDLTNTRLDVDTGDTLTLRNTVNSTDVIHLNDTDANAINQARLNLTSGDALTGGGVIQFESTNQNVLAGLSGVIEIAADRTLRTVGAGSKGDLQATFVNKGTIEADAGSFSFSSSDKSNQGLIQASNGGALEFSSSIDLDQTGGGEVRLDGGSTLGLANGVLTNGSVTGGGRLLFTGTATVDGVDLTNTRLDVDTSETLTLRNTVNSTDIIHINDTDANAINQARLNLTSGDALTGGGIIQFESANQNVLAGLGGTIDIAADRTVRTQGAGSRGEIQATINNLGVIQTDAGTLAFTGTDKLNKNLIQASNGGVLNFGSSIDLDQTGGGEVRLDATSQLQMSNGILTNGSVTGGGTLVYAGSNTLDGVDLTDTRVELGSSNTLTLRNTVNSTNVIELNDTDSSINNNARLILTGGDDLTGGGAIRFASANQNRIQSTGGEVVFGAGLTIETDGVGSRGEITADFANLGTIRTDAGELTFSSFDKVNQGLISAGNGASLTFNSGIDLDQTDVGQGAGVVDLDASSNISLTNNIVTGGRIQGGGTIDLQGTVTFDGVSLDAVSATVETAEALKLMGTVTNDGTLVLNDLDASTINRADLNASGHAILAGSGELRIEGGNQNRIGGGTGTSVSLTVGQHQTVHSLAGSNGSIQTNLNNQGEFIIDGLLDVGSFVTFTNEAGGVISGSGEFDVNGTLTNAGILTAGNSPGTLTFTDTDIDNAVSSELLIEIAGVGGVGNQGLNYDFLNIDGDFEILGDLVVELLNFSPDASQEYFVLSALSFTNGVDDFSNVSSGLASFAFGTASVRIDNGTDLVLFDFAVNEGVTPTPQPLTLAMMLPGLWLMRRRLVKMRA